MQKNDALYWVWLARAMGVASKTFVRLIERFEDPYEIYSLESEEIERIEGVSAKKKAALSDKSLDRSYEVLKFCKMHKVDIVTYADKRYPARLRQLPDAPALLFVKGKLPDFNSRLAISVVGTRKMSEYGRYSAYKIAYELASADAIIVSGMALGVDAVASAGALAAGGSTVAVLGSGIDVVYPSEHRKLYDTICKNGAVITEFMPSVRPDRPNFPKRNRIMSGLSQGTLVIEGDARSGSLITARTALSQGREVFALPGKINDVNAEGPNELIKSGAYATLSSADILEHYDFLYHDVINYKAYKASKNHSELDGRVLGKLEISTKKYIAPLATAEEKIEKERTKKSEAPTEKQAKTAPRAEEVNLDGLDDTSKRIFSEMPIDAAVNPDALCTGGLSAVEVITALTMLELAGLVTSLPGGLYMRK